MANTVRTTKTSLDLSEVFRCLKLDRMLSFLLKEPNQKASQFPGTVLAYGLCGRGPL